MQEMAWSHFGYKYLFRKKIMNATGVELLSVFQVIVLSHQSKALRIYRHSFVLKTSLHAYSLFFELSIFADVCAAITFGRLVQLLQFMCDIKCEIIAHAVTKQI